MTKHLQLYQVHFNAKQLRLPLSLDILIPFDSEVRTFDEVFSNLDVSKYLVSKKKGRIGYNLANMLKLVMFCQMERIYSLRAMEKAAKNDIRIMWLTDETKPSHQAINEFLNNNLSTSISNIFTELNKYLIKADNIDTSKLYIDGTKIESVSNKYKFVWRGSIEKFESKLHLKITKLINLLNKEYYPHGIYFNTFETYDSTYLLKIKSFLLKEVESNNVIFVYGSGKRKKPLQRFFEKISDYIIKLNEYHEHLNIMGPRRNSYSKTDHDATFMRLKEDHMQNQQLKPAYNLQIGVSDEYIIHLDLYQERSDFKTFIPFLEGYNKLYSKYPLYPVADAGYGSLENYRYLRINEMKLYQKYSMYAKDTRDKKYLNNVYRPHNLIKKGEKHYETRLGEKFEYLYTDKFNKDYYFVPSLGKNRVIVEELLEYQKEAIENLQSNLGIELRMQRSAQVEGAFGVIKQNYGIRRFRRRGLDNVKLEMTLIAIGYNLSKFHNKRYRIIN